MKIKVEIEEKHIWVQFCDKLVERKILSEAHFKFFSKTPNEASFLKKFKLIKSNQVGAHA